MSDSLGKPMSEFPALLNILLANKTYVNSAPNIATRGHKVSFDEWSST